MVNTMFVLDRTLNTSHILSANKNSQSAFWEDTYTQEFDTGAESFEFSCYTHESIKEGNYVTFFYNNQYKMFQIIEVQEVHKKGKLVSECYCEIASLQLLNNYVKPFSGDMNCIQFFQHILHGTEWHIGKYSTSLENVVYTVDEKNIESVWSLIEDYKDIYGCEINVRVTYDNGYVTGQYIDIYAEGGLGSSTFKRFEYGRNVTGITKTKDLYDWCTGVILDVECDVSNTVIEERDGYGFTKGAGDVILDDNANRIYNAGRTHVIGVYQGKETEPVEACINAWKELQKRKEPKFDYKVTTALRDDEYEDIHLGDTVYVVDYSYTPPLLLEARVGKLELSFTDRTQNSCTLTNYKEIKSKLLDADYIKLTGTISDVVNAFFPITSEGIADGAIVDGKIETTYFQQITADIVSAGIGAFEDLYVKNMTVINADIESLRATTAEITHLKSQLAEIDTLVNGHLTSDNIQSLILSADKVTVADAFIKDAMIDSVTANKITSGSINTNNVYISSEDGSMVINGSLQQFKDENGKVRIQIGKDAQGDFTFSLFDENGTGVLIDEKGITENAIADGLIVNDMVAENAGIAGSKLDIDSVVTEINEGSTTIKGTKIVVDDNNQTLDMAFSSLSTKVDEVQETTDSNSTAINVQQGQIDTLISNTTITKENGEVVQLKDEYNSTKNTVDSHTTKIGSLETTVNEVSSKQSSMELDLDGFRTEVSSTYATKGELTGLGSNYVTKTEFNQTNEDFTFKISQGGGGNLLRNSDFYDVMNGKWDYWNFWGNCYQYTEIWLLYESFENAMIIDNQSTSTEGGFYQPIHGIKPNTEYTFSANLTWGSNTRGVYVAIEYYTSDGTRISNVSPSIHSDIDIRQSLTFTTPANCSRVNVVFNHNGSTDGSSAFFVIQRPCLVEGYGSVWVPHSKEMYDGIVKIDKYGLTVQHNSNKSVLDSEALKFYEGSTLKSKVDGGTFKFTDAGGTALGEVGCSSWVYDRSKSISILKATYGHSVALSAPYSSTATTSTVGVVHSSHDHWVANDMVLYQGVSISNPKIIGVMNLKPQWNTTMQDYNGTKYGHLTLWGSTVDGLGYSGYIAGNNYLGLGALAGSSAKLGLAIYEDSSYSGGTRLVLGGPLQMNGWSMMNARSTMDLNAQSRYTKSLLSEGTNEHISYGTLSYSDNEIRWCWKENVFTYQDCDIDPVTDEWVYLDRYICYIELPIFMAENIEADYHINVSKMSWGDWRIREKNQYYFILESEENDFAFTFEVVAKLKDGSTIDTNSYVANDSVSEFNVELPQDFKDLEIPIDNIQENIITGEE